MTSPTGGERAGERGAAPLEILEGECWVYVAFDVGRAIDLDAAAGRLARSQRDVVPSRKRGPAFLEFHPAPLAATVTGEPIEVAGWRTMPEVECTLFDFGAVSVAYRIAIRGSLASLAGLAEGLETHAGLRADARRRVERLVEELGPAVAQGRIAEVSEDYVVYHARRWAGGAAEGSGVSPASVLSDQRREVARLLRATPADIAEEEVADAVSARISYSARDACVVDWIGAVVFDERAEDTLAVLEFANVELLELRYLDDKLDEILDRAYHLVHRPGGLRRSLLGMGAEDRRRLAGLQVDAAMLFEGVNNALKLVGDQYLARLYRLAAGRFHLSEWDASITRKLEAVQGIYQKLVDEAGARRMEVLEWIIIILIAVSIVLPFVWTGAK